VQFVAQRQLLETFAEGLCVELDSQPEGRRRFWQPLVASTDAFSARERPTVNVQWRDEYLSGSAQLSVDDGGHLVLGDTPYPDDTPMMVLQHAITVKARGALFLSPGDDYRLKRALGGYEAGVVLRFLKVQETHTTTCFQFEVANPAAGRGPELLDGTRRYRGLTLFEDSPDDARVIDAMGDWFEPLKDERDVARQVDLLVEIGTYLREHGALAAARERLEAALALDPNHAVATFQRGWVAAQQEQWDEARVLFAKAAELDPSGPFPKNNEAWALGRLGRWSESLAILDALVQSFPACAEAHRNKGWVLRNLGRLEEARSACERAIALSPTYAGGLHEAGLVAIHQQRWDDAVAYLERAAALVPADAVIAAALVAARAACNQDSGQ
jgi:tetratricopeptide (TPR) repeat protein